jgi:hypothetical protein
LFDGPEGITTACPAGGIWTDVYPADNRQHLEGILARALVKSKQDPETAKTELNEDQVLKEVSL